MELIIFTLGELLYSVDATKVREILTYIPATKLPNTKDWINGVINIRGEVTPIVDLRVRFKTTTNPIYNENIPIIAIKTTDNRMIGVVVDGIDTLVEVKSSSMIDVSQDYSNYYKYLKGLFIINGKSVALIDSDVLLGKEELE